MSDWESRTRVNLLQEAEIENAGDDRGVPRSEDDKNKDIPLSLEQIESKAIATMSDLMDDMDSKVRLGAAQDVLDRVGKPRRKNDAAGGGGRTVILNFPPSAITDALKGMREFIDVDGREGKDGKGVPLALPAQT